MGVVSVMYSAAMLIGALVSIATGGEGGMKRDIENKTLVCCVDVWTPTHHTCTLTHPHITPGKCVDVCACVDVNKCSVFLKAKR